MLKIDAEDSNQDIAHYLYVFWNPKPDENDVQANL